MQSHREVILQQALSLPAEDRAFVIAALEKSIAGNPLPLDAVAADSDAALSGPEFARELERRSAAYRAGETTSRPATDVLAEMRRREASV